MGNWAVYPAVTGLPYSHQAYPISLGGTYSFWLFQGRAPKNGQEVEIIIAEFKFIPAP